MSRGATAANSSTCSDFQLHHDLFKKIPVDLMFRYNFVPLEETADGRLAIAIADPSQLMMIDEISLLLKQAHRHQSFDAEADLRHSQEDRAVAARAGRSQRRLPPIIREDENTGAEETLSIDKLTARGRHQPDHPPGRYHDFHRAAAAGLRHSHRDSRRLGGHQVPH